MERETKDGLQLGNGIDITVATNSFRSVRGRPILLAILDEAAFFLSETSASPDTELYTALRPAPVTLSGSRIIIISSPYRKAGLLWGQYKRFFGKDNDDTLVIQASVRQLNPTIPQSVVDAAFEEDPTSARSEWGGQFRDDIDGWASAELIAAAVDTGVTVRPPSTNRYRFKYWSFCDPSGGARDSFTCAIAHVEDDIAVLDCLVEVRAPFNPQEATATIAAVLQEYGLRDTVGDKYAAELGDVRICTIWNPVHALGTRQVGDLSRCPAAVHFRQGKDFG